MFASAKGLRELFSGLRSTSMLAAPWFLLSSFSCLFVRSFVCCFALVGLFVLHCNWNVFYWRFVSNEITISAVLSCSNALSSETSCSSPRRRWVGGWTRELTYLFCLARPLEYAPVSIFPCAQVVIRRMRLKLWPFPSVFLIAFPSKLL